MGFNPRLAPYSQTLMAFESDPAADKEYQWFRFPVGGSFIGANATNDANVTGTTNQVAVFFTKYSTTFVAQGTLASIAAGASWTADAPRAAVVTSFGSTAQFVAGESIRLKYDEVTTGLLNDASFQIDYVLGHQQGPTPAAATGPA